MVFLGVLRTSVGFGIQQSMQIAGNQLVGLISGERKGVYGKPLNLRYMGLAVILIAVIAFPYSNIIVN